MKNSLKKLMASATAVAIVTMNMASFTANAAGVVTTVTSGNRTTFTIDLPAGVNLAPTNNFSLYIKNATTGAPVNIAGGSQISAITVGWGNEFAQVTNAWDAAGTITVTNMATDPAVGWDVVFTLGAALADNTAYTVSYTDSQGNFSAASINFGTANTVVVTASVIPVLTMALVGGTLTLGDLAIDTNKSSSDEVNITVKTNALNGATVTATSTNGWLSSASAAYTIDEDNANTELYGLAINAATMGASIVTAPTNAFNTAGSNAIQVATTWWAPTTAAGVTRYIKATTTIDDNTPAAGDYTDTLTFTTVGSF